MRGTRTLSIALAACSLIQVSSLTGAHAAPPSAAAGDPARVLAATTTQARPAAVNTSTALRAAADKSDTAAPFGPEEHARLLQVALQGLRSSEASTIQDSLLQLKELRGRAAADAISARLKQGLPPQLTESALEVLSGLDQPIAVPILAELTQHRRWQIREKAVAALGGLRVRSSVSVLLYALDDPSPEVRASAARALGLAGDPRAIPSLISAIARGVDGALEGLAQLAGTKQVEAILARASADLKASEPALWVLLSRANVPPVTKHKVIQFVQNHDSSDEAEQVLAAWRERLKSAGDLRLLALLSHPATAPAAQPEKPKAALTPGLAAQTRVAVSGGKP